ncbi:MULTISPECIES: primary-amine oxidase [unclassified Microbacterium]|uniref:primary-amine oxidase n=1 Tax=unclassified Microbacterium TaxID=2609290 RepID=UPI0030192443
MPSVTTTRPLAPLTAEEISTAVEALRNGPAAAPTFRFSSVALREPRRSELRTGTFSRSAEAVLVDRATARTYEAEVDLTTGEVTSWLELAEGIHAPIMLDEFADVERVSVEHPDVIAGLARRGITDMALVCVEPWSIGYFGEEQSGKRLMRALVYVRLEPDDNPYAHPVENFTILFDLAAGEVVAVEDDGFLHVPQEKNNYLPRFVGPARTDIKPLEITFPQGRNFTVEGHHVEWADWSFDIGFTPREGLVLHNIAWKDHRTAEVRSILNRASVTEMVVPYGAPSRSQQQKNAFDAGEYNFGYMTNSLTLGCDCLGDIQYFDATLVTSKGKPFTIQNAICLHEEDDSIAWKHWDFRTNDAQTRRSRRLVISFIVTVANYEYAFYWHLRLDGTIRLEVKATGILSTAAQEPGAVNKYGQTLNNDGLWAPIHEHIFNARLDWAVDGEKNSVLEYETVTEYDGDPAISPFYAQETLLRTEQEAARLPSPLTHRFWKVVSSDRTNKVGERTAYRVNATDPVVIKKHPDSWVTRRAQFATKSIWVTKHEEDERYPAGEYPNQSRGHDGLPAYIAGDDSIVDEDIVMWHSFGVHHVVRVEDWPVMPTQSFGFFLEPFGFFDENPTLDLPVTEADGSTCAPHSADHDHDHAGHDHAGHDHAGHAH